VDDFEDGHYKDVDPWLQGPNQQGLSWNQDVGAAFKHYVTNDDTILNRNSLLDPLGATGQQRVSWISSVQGSDWADYTFEFTAHNAYLVIGSGPVVLAVDQDNYYWLDISRDNGRLIRTMGGNSTVLATSSAIQMPHSGEQTYKISVSHVSGDIRIEVDVNPDGNPDFSYTDTDPTAAATFTAGGVAFHNDTDSVYHKIRYDDITVTVSAFSGGPANLPPTADAGPDQNVTDSDDSGSEDITLDGSGSSDSDGTIVSYEWEEASVPIATGVSPTVAMSVAVHTVDLIVTDDDTATGTDSVVITVNPHVNVPPTADAGPDQNVTDSDDSGDEDVTLDGSGSTDSDGTIVSYEWEESSVPIATGVSPVVTLSVAVHTIDLIVTDDDSDTDTDSVQATVNPYVNIPPTADAGPDQAVTDFDDGGDEDVTLDGSGSFDSDGTIVSYEWEESSLPVATGVSPVVTLSVAVHTIDLTVTDDDSDTGSDSVVITVDPAPPGETRRSPYRTRPVRSRPSSMRCRTRTTWTASPASYWARPRRIATTPASFGSSRTGRSRRSTTTPTCPTRRRRTRRGRAITSVSR